MTSQGIVSVEWAAVHVAHYDDSGVCMFKLQCLLILFFFFILSVFFLGMIWVFCSSLPL